MNEYQKALDIIKVYPRNSKEFVEAVMTLQKLIDKDKKKISIHNVQDMIGG